MNKRSFQKRKGACKEGRSWISLSSFPTINTPHQRNLLVVLLVFLRRHYNTWAADLQDAVVGPICQLCLPAWIGIWGEIKPPVQIRLMGMARFLGKSVSGNRTFRDTILFFSLCCSHSGYMSLFSSTVHGTFVVYLWDCFVQIVYSVLRALYTHH